LFRQVHTGVENGIKEHRGHQLRSAAGFRGPVGDAKTQGCGRRGVSMTKTKKTQKPKPKNKTKQNKTKHTQLSALIERLRRRDEPHRDHSRKRKLWRQAKVGDAPELCRAVEIVRIIFEFGLDLGRSNIFGGLKDPAEEHGNDLELLPGKRVPQTQRTQAYVGIRRHNVEVQFARR
jgi:hypothetical protein